MLYTRLSGHDRCHTRLSGRALTPVLYTRLSGLDRCHVRLSGLVVLFSFLSLPFFLFLTLDPIMPRMMGFL